MLAQNEVVCGHAVIWEIRKFEAASIGDAISAAHFYQHTFVVGQNKRPLRVPPASTFLPQSQLMSGKMHPMQHCCAA